VTSSWFFLSTLTESSLCRGCINTKWESHFCWSIWLSICSCYRTDESKESVSDIGREIISDSMQCDICRARMHFLLQWMNVRTNKFCQLLKKKMFRKYLCILLLFWSTSAGLSISTWTMWNCGRLDNVYVSIKFWQFCMTSKAAEFLCLFHYILYYFYCF